MLSRRSSTPLAIPWPMVWARSSEPAAAPGQRGLAFPALLPSPSTAPSASTRDVPPLLRLRRRWRACAAGVGNTGRERETIRAAMSRFSAASWLANRGEVAERPCGRRRLARLVENAIANAISRMRREGKVL
jgi:hypothetical protein